MDWPILILGDYVVKKGLAKALERKMGLDEGLISQIETKSVDSSLLMNRTRLSIFQFICNNPGAHLRMISRELDFSTQTATWHLKKLVHKGLISRSKFANKNHYFPLDDIFSGEEQRILALFYDLNVKRIYLHIKDNPDVDQTSMVSDLNIYQQLLSKAIIALQRYHLITHKTQNRTRLYRLTDRLEEIKENFQGQTKIYENMLVQALTQDGVDPKIISTEGDIIKIELDSGGSKRTFLAMEKNPYKTIFKGS
jgi:DNA-binding MarR family transcriptional regulator